VVPAVVPVEPPLVPVVAPVVSFEAELEAPQALRKRLIVATIERYFRDLR
jgi:hypothetical protein